jgi:hypothetical protein
MAATPVCCRNSRDLHTLRAVAAPHARAPAWVRRTPTRPALNLCCHRERAELRLTGMFSS